VPAAAPPEPKRPSTEVLQAQARRAERAAALRRALAEVKRCERELAEARAARAALDADPEPPEPHEYRTYEGTAWLAAKRGAFSPPLDTEAVARAYRERAEGSEGRER
jgi:hypothetical protein